MQVYTGPSEQSELAGVFCGGNIPEPITSTTGFYIVFKTDDDTNGYGFNITYTKIPSTVTGEEKPN